MISLVYGFGIKKDSNKCAKCGDAPPTGYIWGDGPRDTEWSTKPICSDCHANTLIEKRNAELAEERDEAKIVP